MMPEPDLFRPEEAFAVGAINSCPLALTENWSEMTERVGHSLLCIRAL